jgi:Phage related hypothetical protein (DUF1799)
VVGDDKTDDVQADLKRFGVAEDDIKKVRDVLEARDNSGVDPQGFLLWPQHIAPLMVFDASATQWRFKANGMAPSSHEGLDYAAVKVVMDGEGLKLDAQGWRDLRVLEDEALVFFNKAKPRS